MHDLLRDLGALRVEFSGLSRRQRIAVVVSACAAYWLLVATAGALVTLFSTTTKRAPLGGPHIVAWEGHYWLDKERLAALREKRTRERVQALGFTDDLQRELTRDPGLLVHDGVYTPRDNRSHVDQSCVCSERGVQTCLFCNQSPFAPAPDLGFKQKLPVSAGSKLRLRVSRVFCVGGVGLELLSWNAKAATIGNRDWAKATCVFRDLIWLPKLRSWLFVHARHRKPSWDFPGHLMFNASAYPRRSPPQLDHLLSHPVRLLEVDVPANGGDIGVVGRDELVTIPELRMLHRAPGAYWHLLARHNRWTATPCHPGKRSANFGHFLGDYVWGIFMMMQTVRLCGRP
jgi:hypothetical protein